MYKARYWLVVLFCVSLLTLFWFGGCSTTERGKVHFYHFPVEMRECYGKLCVELTSLLPETREDEHGTLTYQARVRENTVVVTYGKEVVVDLYWFGGMLSEYQVEGDVGVERFLVKEMFEDGSFRWLVLWDRPSGNW